ncbi:MAG: PD-(D/E)XK nuclease family protein [Planctomycetota bacterium]
MTAAQLALRTSPSTAIGLKDCPHRWREKKRRGEAAPSMEAAEKGTAFHQFVELYGRHCMQQKKQSDPGEAGTICASLADKMGDEWRDELKEWMKHFASEWNWPVGAELQWFEFETKIALDTEGKVVDYDTAEDVHRVKIDFTWCVKINGKLIVGIIDWKSTSSQLADGVEAKTPQYQKTSMPKDLQLRWYVHAARARWPEADGFRAGHYYVKSGHWCLTTVIKKEKVDSAGTLDEMNVVLADLRRRDEQDDFPATPCSWCENCQFGPTTEKGDDTCPHFLVERSSVKALMSGEEDHVGDVPDERTVEDDGDITEYVSPPKGPKIQPNEDEQKARTEIMENSIKAAEGAKPHPKWESPDDFVDRIIHKVFIYGDTGTRKTRSMLTAFTDRREGGGRARLAVADSEDGSRPYKGEFLFYRKVITTQAGLLELIDNLPDGVDALGIDSWTVFCDKIDREWRETFLKFKRGKGGHFGKFYELQGKDYDKLNDDKQKVIEQLILAQHHVVCIAQPKAEYDDAPGAEMMKKIGTTFDGYKRTAFYFDTVIRLEKVRGTDKITAHIEKDRWHLFADTKRVEWTDDTLRSYLFPGGAAPQAPAESSQAPWEEPDEVPPTAATSSNGAQKNPAASNGKADAQSRVLREDRVPVAVVEAPSRTGSVTEKQLGAIGELLESLPGGRDRYREIVKEISGGESALACSTKDAQTIIYKMIDEGAEAAWSKAVLDISEALDKCDDLPEAADEFRQSVEDKLRSMSTWILENYHVTEKQLESIENMTGGIDRWLK